MVRRTVGLSIMSQDKTTIPKQVRKLLKLVDGVNVKYESTTILEEGKEKEVIIIMRA